MPKKPSGTLSSETLRRIDQLLFERDVTSTMNAYAHTLDYGDEAGFLNCFTEDGAFHVLRRGSRAGLRHYRGKKELGEFFRQHTHAPERYHKHVMVQPVITRRGKRANVDSYFARLDGREGGPFINTFGRYKDKFLLGDDGMWRIVDRRVEIEHWTGPPSSS